jgi:hypothetical protein
MTAHQPFKTSWKCAGCLLPWPCPSRQAQLRASYIDSPVCLTLVMGSAFIEAASDLRNRTAGELYEQFIGWIETVGTVSGDG